MKKNDYVFLFAFIIIIIVGSSTIFRTGKNKSDLENRELNKFPRLTVRSYLNGSFQNDIEGAFTDQFWGSGTIKKNYDKLFDITTFVNNNKKLCKNNYYNIGERAIYDCSDYFIIFNPYPSEEDSNAVIEKIKNYSKLNNIVDTYYYFINSSRLYDFRKDEYTANMKEIFKDNMSGNYHYSEFKFNDFDEYKNYYYKTDHHWNHRGSYKGYTEIMKMFGITDVIKPIDEVTFKGLYFYGTHATISRKYNVKEDFTVYKFELPTYKSYINGIEKNYGNEENYFNGEYNKNKHTGLYGDFYGGDKAEVVFDFNNKEKDNLLIIGNSYTNPVNKLVSSHFNKTYVIDLRAYEKAMGYKFNVNNYIKDHNISKVLVLADYSFYLADIFMLDWGDK